MEANLDDYLVRRIEFLIREACHNAKRDQSITYVMRVLSNFATIGSDAGSVTIKLRNKRVSAGAQFLLDTCTEIRDWTNGTVNEHQVPLNITWSWLLEFGDRLTTAEVWQHFIDNPMITLLNDEDRILTKSGLRSGIGEAGRYSSAGIKIVHLTEEPKKLLDRRLKY